MKLRFLFLACTLLAGRAMAQGCSTKPIKFPLQGGTDYQVPSGTCIASTDSSGTQTGRLRWDNNGNGLLQLFDTDGASQPQVWCAHDSSGNCAEGQILCLQQDGNMVIYTSVPGNPATDCGNGDGDNGAPVWSTGTNGCGVLQLCLNEDIEELAVTDNLILDGVGHGEAAVLYNDANQPSADEPKQRIWYSTSNN